MSLAAAIAQANGLRSTPTADRPNAKAAVVSGSAAVPRVKDQRARRQVEIAQCRCGKAGREPGVVRVHLVVDAESD